MCESMLLSRAGYVSHLKGHRKNQKQTKWCNLPYRLANNTCIVCNCILQIIIWPEEDGGCTQKSYKAMQIQATQPMIDFICLICRRHMKSNAGLEESQEPWTPNRSVAVTSDAKGEKSAHIRVRCSSHLVYMFVPCTRYIHTLSVCTYVTNVNFSSRSNVRRH